MRVAAVSAAIYTKTDCGTPPPVSASRARDDVPASPLITDTDVTVRPMICESALASRSPIVRGSDRTRPTIASSGDTLDTAAQMRRQADDRRNPIHLAMFTKLR